MNLLVLSKNLSRIDGDDLSRMTNLIQGSLMFVDAYGVTLPM
jgi:hypothetical protein